MEAAAKEACEYRLLPARSVLGHGSTSGGPMACLKLSSVLGSSPPVRLAESRPERSRQLAGLDHASTTCWRLTAWVNGISTSFLHE